LVADNKRYNDKPAGAIEWSKTGMTVDEPQAAAASDPGGQQAVDVASGLRQNNEYAATPAAKTITAVKTMVFQGAF
jgi:hypothetical protein